MKSDDGVSSTFCVPITIVNWFKRYMWKMMDYGWEEPRHLETK